MSGEFDIQLVCNSIAALAFENITTKRPDELKPIDLRECPVLQPYPQAGITFNQVEVMSYGSASARKNWTCTVGYGLFVAPVGAERGLHTVWPSLQDYISEVVNVITANDYLDGAEDVFVSAVTQSAPILDPADKQFHGAVISITFMRMYNP